MPTFTDIQPGESVDAQLVFPALTQGENCCTINWQAVCANGETSSGTESVCVTPEVSTEKTTVICGLPYIAWSLQDQRLRDFDRVAWSFKAPISMTTADLQLVHRWANPPNGSYSAGDGGRVRYQAYEGKLPNGLGNQVYESPTDIIFTPDLYGSRPSNTQQPTRSVGNQGRQPFPFVVDLVKGQWYTVVVERVSGSGDHGSVNSFLVPDEDRDRKDVLCGILDPREWQIWRTPNGSNNWQRRNNQIAIFEITNGAGIAFGNGFSEELAAPQTDRLYNLSGNNQMRWCFNTSYQLRDLEFCMALVRRSGTSPVIIDFKDGAGNTWHTASLNFSSNPIPTGSVSGNLNDWLLQHARWQQVTLPASVIMPAGQKYICARTSGDTNFEIAGLRDSSDSNWSVGYKVDPADGCPSLVSGDPGGFMEISTNGGNSFFKPQQWSNTNTDDVQPAMMIKGCNL